MAEVIPFDTDMLVITCPDCGSDLVAKSRTDVDPTKIDALECLDCQVLFLMEDGVIMTAITDQQREASELRAWLNQQALKDSGQAVLDAEGAPDWQDYPKHVALVIGWGLVAGIVLGVLIR